MSKPLSERLEWMADHCLTTSKGSMQAEANLYREAAALARRVEVAPGEVVVTKNEHGAIVLVSRQDADGHLLSVIAAAGPVPPMCPECTHAELLYECPACSANNYPDAPPSTEGGEDGLRPNELP